MEEIIEKCKQIVVKIYDKFDASHDFAHIERVMKNAEEILARTSANRKSYVLLLLHDIEDAKYKSNENPTVIEILQSIGAMINY